MNNNNILYFCFVFFILPSFHLYRSFLAALFASSLPSFIAHIFPLEEADNKRTIQHSQMHHSLLPYNSIIMLGMDEFDYCSIPLQYNYNNNEQPTLIN
jgi:hypothetical protein